MKVQIQNLIKELPLDIMQRLGSLNNPIKEAEVFIRELCELNPDDIPIVEQATAYKQWMQSLTYSVEEAPTSFKIGKRTFSVCHEVINGKEFETLLNMPLVFLYEIVNTDVDIEKFKAIDNITALMYREDWTKPFSQKEYFENAMFFEKQKCKFSLWGMRKYNELIVILKDTYPILYQGNNDDKTDDRKMYDMMNALSGDNPTRQKDAEGLEIWRAFTWMEHKKKEALKKKLNKR